MSNYVPRIEYLNTSFTGDTTDASNVIDDIADTSALQVGMTITHANFPDETTITTVNASDIVVSNNATATSNDVSIDAVHRIDFDFPPNEFDVFGDTRKYVGKVSVSANGKYQTSFNYTEEDRKLNFRFVTQTIKDLLVSFMDNHGGLGREFRYYNDKDVADYESYKIEKGNRKLRPARKFAQDLYTIKLRMRRVI